MLLVIALSLLAALLFALSAALQQRAAQQTARESRAAGERTPRSGPQSWLPVLGFLDRLLRSRLWLLGWLTNLAGFLIQAAALHVGSLAVVQPLLVTQLLFALPLSVASTRSRLLPQDWFGAACICSGLVILLAVRGVAPPAAEADRAHVLLATAAALALIVVLVAVARKYHDKPQVRAAMISVAAGVCFAMTAVFIKLTAGDLVHNGIPATASDWPGYALAGSTLLGLLLEQDAFATGSLATAVAAMTITNPFASYILGVLAFAADAPDEPGALGGLASAGLLVAGGVIALAGSPTMRGQLVRRDEGTGAVMEALPGEDPVGGGTGATDRGGPVAVGEPIAGSEPAARVGPAARGKPTPTGTEPAGTGSGTAGTGAATPQAGSRPRRGGSQPPETGSSPPEAGKRQPNRRARLR